MKAKDTGGISVQEFLSIFDLFSDKEQVKIAKVIQKKTLAERWSALKDKLPDIGISEEDVMDEVKAVRNKRYGKG